jgi:hypothetical protein
MRNMITLFLEDTPNYLGQMVKTFDTGDLPKVRSVAHKMKSPVELFGIPGASQDIKTIETMTAEGYGGKAMKDALDRAVSTLNLVVAQLSEDPVLKTG